MDTEHTPLLPCPFCGGKATHKLISAYSMDSSFYAIQCGHCFAMIYADEKPTEADIAEWNKRTPVQTPVHSVNLLPELVEALREARPHVAHSTISVAGAVGRRSATEIAATIDALLAKATS